MLSWALAAGIGFVLPCYVAWQLELNPSTTYLNHALEAITLLVGGLVLLIVPTPAIGHKALPDEHLKVFRYAISRGVLPIASLFSSWKEELAHRRRLFDLALRYLPFALVTALTADIYGYVLDPQSQYVFLATALFAIVLALHGFSRLTIALQNIDVLEQRLQLQAQFLASQGV